MRKMKTVILFLSVVLTIASCEKAEDNSPPNLSVTSSDWFTTTTGNLTDGFFGNVYLSISGATNADNVTIETYGDGEISEHSLLLDSNNNFNDTICISFIHFSHTIPTGEMESNTKIKAIKSNDTLVVTLNSSKITF